MDFTDFSTLRNVFISNSKNDEILDNIDIHDESLLNNISLSNSAEYIY